MTLLREARIAELARGALQAKENKLGRLVEILVAAEVGAPAGVVGRHPRGAALGYGNVSGLHRLSLGRRAQC